jgi:hypothetical protein
MLYCVKYQLELFFLLKKWIQPFNIYCSKIPQLFVLYFVIM